MTFEGHCFKQMKCVLQLGEYTISKNIDEDEQEVICLSTFMIFVKIS